VVESVEVLGPAAPPAGRGCHPAPHGAVARLGDRLEAQDPYGTWYDASVVGERGHGDARELLVHYKGWKNRYDDWLGVGSGGLRAASLS